MQWLGELCSAVSVLKKKFLSHDVTYILEKHDHLVLKIVIFDKLSITDSFLKFIENTQIY